MDKNEIRGAAKPKWEEPTIEEIDYAQTEAQYGIPGTAEFGLYTN